MSLSPPRKPGSYLRHTTARRNAVERLEPRRLLSGDSTLDGDGSMPHPSELTWYPDSTGEWWESTWKEVDGLNTPAPNDLGVVDEGFYMGDMDFDGQEEIGRESVVIKSGFRFTDGNQMSDWGGAAIVSGNVNYEFTRTLGRDFEGNIKVGLDGQIGTLLAGASKRVTSTQSTASGQGADYDANSGSAPNTQNRVEVHHRTWTAWLHREVFFSRGHRWQTLAFDPLDTGPGTRSDYDDKIERRWRIPNNGQGNPGNTPKPPVDEDDPTFPGGPNDIPPPGPPPLDRPALTGRLDYSGPIAGMMTNAFSNDLVSLADQPDEDRVAAAAIVG